MPELRVAPDDLDAPRPAVAALARSGEPADWPTALFRRTVLEYADVAHRVRHRVERAERRAGRQREHAAPRVAARARAATREPREERGLGVRARVEREAVAVEEVPRVVDAEGLDLREDRREHFVVRRPVPRRLRRETERRTRERASASGGDDTGERGRVSRRSGASGGGRRGCAREPWSRSGPGSPSAPRRATMARRGRRTTGTTSRRAARRARPRTTGATRAGRRRTG